MKKHFFNKDVELAITEWLKTGDEILFADKIYLPLKYLCHAITRKYRFYKYTDLDIQNLMGHVVHKLSRFDKTRNTKLITYLYKVGRNYYNKEYQMNTMQKRDYRLNVELPDTNRELEKIFGYLPKNNDNAIFIEWMLGYWKHNAHKHFSFRRLVICKLIVDIIQHTECYPYDGSSYAVYITKKLNTSRQAVNQVVQRMKEYNRLLHNNYLRNGLLGLL